MTNSALKILLHKLGEELTVIELFAFQMYFQPRDGAEPADCLYDPASPAFSYQADPDYIRLNTAIKKVRAATEVINERL